jgi:hypothetical protein
MVQDVLGVNLLAVVNFITQEQTKLVMQATVVRHHTVFNINF